MEQDHAVRRREEAKRIRLEQDRDYTKFQEQLKLMKKEVNMCQVEAGGLEVLGPCWLQGSEPQLNLTLSTEEYWGACMPEKLTTRHIWICAPTAPLGATSPSFSSPSAFLCVVLAPRQALDMWLGSFLSILPA